MTQEYIDVNKWCQGIFIKFNPVCQLKLKRLTGRTDNCSLLVFSIKMSM